MAAAKNPAVTLIEHSYSKLALPKSCKKKGKYTTLVTQEEQEEPSETNSDSFPEGAEIASKLHTDERNSTELGGELDSTKIDGGNDTLELNEIEDRGNDLSTVVEQPTGYSLSDDGYNCDTCGKILKRKAAIVAHVIWHDQEVIEYGSEEEEPARNSSFREYRCYICLKRFNTIACMLSHRKNVHFAAFCQCDICGKILKCKKTLKYHMLVHSPPKFKCGLCNLSVRSKDLLRQHEKMHTDHRPHVCKICGKGFRKPSLLKYHCRVHTGEKPYMCKTCGRSFGKLETLYKHERIHTGDKPHKCEFCGHSFIQKVALYKHWKTHPDYSPGALDTRPAYWAKRQSLKNSAMQSSDKTSELSHFTEQATDKIQGDGIIGNAGEIDSTELGNESKLTELDCEKNAINGGEYDSTEHGCEENATEVGQSDLATGGGKMGSTQLGVEGNSTFGCEIDSTELADDRLSNTNTCAKLNCWFESSDVNSTELSNERKSSGFSCDLDSCEDDGVIDSPGFSNDGLKTKVTLRSPSSGMRLNSVVRLEPYNEPVSDVVKTVNIGPSRTNNSKEKLTGFAMTDVGYRCDTCGKTLRRQAAMVAHVKWHQGSSDVNPLIKFGLRRRSAKRVNIGSVGASETSSSKEKLTENSLKVHVSNDISCKPHLCKTCGKSFKRLDHLREHSVIHTDDGTRPYECPTCGLTFKLYNGLYRHQRTVHICTPHKPHECEVCGAKFKQKGYLYRHWGTHPDYSPGALDSRRDQVHNAVFYQCDTCHKVLKGKQSFKNHLLKHEKKFEEKCRFCDKIYKHRYFLKEHEKKHSLGSLSQVHTCEICGKEFDVAYKLRYHQRVHTREKPFVCKTCGQSFLTSSHMRLHERIHTGYKPHKCEVCGDSFRIKSLLYNHWKKHPDYLPGALDTRWAYRAKYCIAKTESNTSSDVQAETNTIPLFVCSVCSKQFDSRENLQKHHQVAHTHTLKADEKKHSKSGPNICEICGKEFKCAWYLRFHHRVHTGEKPFACKICGRLFTHASVLRQHERTHSCELCGDTFIHKSELYKHWKKHPESSTTDNQVFVCDVCSKQFDSLKSLKDHTQEVHNAPCQCDTCGKLFKDMKTLKRHWVLFSHGVAS